MKLAPGLKLASAFLLAFFGIFIGLSGYTFYYAQGSSYLSNDPKACANCHIMREQYDSWQKSSHHAVAACNDCHVPPGLVRKYISKLNNGFHHSKGFTLQDFEEPVRGRPENRAVILGNCLYCHGEFVSMITSVPDNSMSTPDCINCHSSVGHGFRR